MPFMIKVLFYAFQKWVENYKIKTPTHALDDDFDLTKINKNISYLEMLLVKY